MTTGTVKWFNPKKGFGFIAPEGEDNDIFVHITAVQQAGLDRLDEGDKVEFEIVEDRGKKKADNLKKI
ncbi:MAG: cold-shock protein [Pelagibacteraceae bacterium]|jgi:CspA family cold shock protein|nr:cold-shock protein [Pelagibacteraceae bacterium]|tara:strand:- start:3582 stop:3785 length:204 start_codon:yes stop_codon:yes gene_type:complete